MVDITDDPESAFEILEATDDALVIRARVPIVLIEPDRLLHLQPGEVGHTDYNVRIILAPEA